MLLNVAWFDDVDIIQFPDVETALSDPDGLLALGGNLSIETLKTAYRYGIFPWFSEDDPIMWWSPSQRAIIRPSQIHISKNMKKLIKQQRYRITMDKAFISVLRNCTTDSDIIVREDTWITTEMQWAYQNLFEKNIAHSVEVWNENDKLVGGLYGVFVKNCFCGESMFSNEKNTSKLALIHLAKFLQSYRCEMIDCQLPTTHLMSLGAEIVPRKDFISTLNQTNDNQQLINRDWSTLWQQYSV